MIAAAVALAAVVLAHVEVIDGTGAPPLYDRNVTIANGKIIAIAPATDVPPRDGTTVIDLRGRAVMPGIVGMHDHLFIVAPGFFQEMRFSASRLYLANGVTTIRTTGSANPYADLELRRKIDSEAEPGPHIDVTGPYLSDLRGPEDARETVAFWADRGVTSFKAYVHITRDELRAAVDEAHKRGLKVTGHLCSVTYAEAVDAGIDNLEHGFFVNTALDPDKKPDTCSTSRGDYTLEHMSDADADALIKLLVAHHVAITSTLPSTAAAADHNARLEPGALDAMTPALRDSYIAWRNRPSNAQSAMLLKKDMALERAFVAAGGLLLAGPDPVGIGGLVPGFADHRQIELLVDAGFTPLEAIRIATLNGATFLGRQNEIGSIAAGKNADLVVVKGDPAAHIGDIENIELVFKDGVSIDRAKLLESVKARYGEY